MEEELIKKLDEKIKEIVDTEINVANIEYLCKLAKVRHMAKEDKEMNYGNYGNYGRPKRGSYGEYGYGAYNYGNYGNEYGRRGVDAKYRAGEEMDRMAGEYARYSESYGRYGNSEETDKAFHYMVKSLEDFIKALHEEAETPQQKQELMQALQNSMK
ncbi:MAG: hypothetical protein J6S67_10880 [Methanobrevibacter sp.]|nr:hypothetical protein [Methanobrevibacter sp.]